MFVVFEDVQKGVYKRSSVSTTTGTEKKSKPEMHIDGPLEIKGRPDLPYAQTQASFRVKVLLCWANSRRPLVDLVG